MASLRRWPPISKNEIPGLSKEEPKIIHTLFNARWLYFHTNVFTAAMFLDSEFITDKHSNAEETEFRDVLKLMADTKDCDYDLDQMVGEWTSLQTALKTETKGDE